MARGWSRTDVIVVDPPRKGLTNSLIESAAKMQPKKVVYVSCNPATLVRDIELFAEQGYTVKQPIQPVDQFPQTTHVESVTVLERKKQWAKNRAVKAFIKAKNVYLFMIKLK